MGNCKLTITKPDEIKEYLYALARMDVLSRIAVEVRVPLGRHVLAQRGYIDFYVGERLQVWSKHADGSSIFFSPEDVAEVQTWVGEEPGLLPVIVLSPA